MSVVISKDELREESLAYLRAQLHNILKKQDICRFDRLTINDLNYRLSIALVHSLNNDTEVELEEQLSRLLKYQEESRKYKQELRNVKEETTKQIQNAHADNENMQRRFDDLEKFLFHLQNKQEKNINLVQQLNSFRQKSSLRETTETELDTLFSSTNTPTSQRVGDIASFKRDFIELVKQQKTLLQKSKTECKQLFLEEVKDKTQLLTINSGIKIEQRKMKEKEEELKRLQRIYSQTIATINHVLHLNLQTTFLDYSLIPDMKTEIKKALRQRIHSRKKKVLKEITHEMPGIEIDDTGNIYKTIQQYISATLLEKERECQKRLRKSTQREQILKSKLTETLYDIRQFRENTFEDSASLLEEIEGLRDEWAQEKKSLDQKMALLNQRMSQQSSSFSVSYLN